MAIFLKFPKNKHITNKKLLFPLLRCPRTKQPFKVIRKFVPMTIVPFEFSFLQEALYLINLRVYEVFKPQNASLVLKIDGVKKKTIIIKEHI